MRPPPSWLITDDFTESELGTLRSGKEAQVSLVERVSGTRSCLLARKSYIPLAVTKGELEDRGFPRSRRFTRDTPYRDDKRMSRRAHREQRAMAKRSSYGRTLLFGKWAAHEHATLQRLWGAGVPVPYPVDQDGETVVMEYLGDREGAAPQLVHAGLDRDGLHAAHAQWLDAMRAMVAEGVVHADLSPYNLLWWDGRLVIIDLPQAVDLLGHGRGFDLLHRDIVNVATWFTRRGYPVDADAIFADLLGHV